MEGRKSFRQMSYMNFFMCFLSVIGIVAFCPSMASAEETELESTTLVTYIVHVNLPENQVITQAEELDTWYHSFLPENKNMVQTYHTVVSGFAAELTKEELEEIQKKEGFVFARPAKRLSLHTTHSPDFLGLHRNLDFWAGSNYGKGVIIGILDTGISPGHSSFDDKDVPPPPAKWKGKCELSGTACNNKLIGARNFVSSSPGLPVDEVGHGTHTASTAAGNFVPNANVFGNANGTAVGMAPLAHLAIYKVCSKVGCLDSDVLAAMDVAVADGVDVLSLSLGGGNSSDFFADAIAIGAFGAIQKGVFVSCSAGNEGPFNATLSNEAPWILTVGASTIDRNMRATVVLGNNKEFDGESLFQPKQDFPRFMPLVYPGRNGNETLALCTPGSLSNLDVKGKVVFCERGGGIARISKGQEVKDAGGFAMILMNQEKDGFSTLADPHVLPASHISYAVGQIIKAYINSTSTPSASIVFKGTILGINNSPVVTSFSSRGPNLASPGILKPDIIGPGVSILAAWPVSVDNNTNEKSATFNMISGTSMSCPHLGGISALLKSSHPDWSPAAIKSAMMTSASQFNVARHPILDERNLTANVFATGSGHVNPSNANDPGLIYDISPDDYIPYLCGLGYSDKQTGVIIGRSIQCLNITTIPEAQLNYPSFSVQLGDTNQQTYTRTVTNVGEANSTYDFLLELIPGVDVSVDPLSLSFTEVNQKRTYKISFSKSATNPVDASFVQGAISWYSVKHVVRSPVSVNFV